MPMGNRLQDFTQRDRRSPTSLVAAALLVAACSSEPVPAPPSLTLSGIVTTDGAPLSHASLLAAAYTSAGDMRLALDTALSDADGAFTLRLEFDTLVAGGYYDLFITPPSRSGLRSGLVSEVVAFDGEGHADTTLAITIDRAEAPVPDGPRQLLGPAHLVGHYDGRSVHPYGPDGGVEVELVIDSIMAGRPYGSYDMWFDASTGCRPDHSLDGTLGPDSLYLSLVAEGSPVQDFVVTSFDVANDTLILDYTESGANLCLGDRRRRSAWYGASGHDSPRVRRARCLTRKCSRQAGLHGPPICHQEGVCVLPYFERRSRASPSIAARLVPASFESWLPTTLCKLQTPSMRASLTS